MGYVQVSGAKSVQDLHRKLIKVNRDIHKSKRVNVGLNIFHIVDSSLITLLMAIKILAMGHDPSARRRNMSFREWFMQLEMWWR